MKKRMNFSWPRGLNLEILKNVLSEEDFIKLIMTFMEKPRLERRIVLPSLRCCQKVLAHAFWCRIEEGKMDWDQIKKDLRKRYGSMAVVGIKKDQIKKLYEQREREIAREKS